LVAIYKTAKHVIYDYAAYTFAQIQTAMKGAKTLEKWRDNLRDQFDHPTEGHLDELFNNYINWR